MAGTSGLAISLINQVINQHSSEAEPRLAGLLEMAPQVLGVDLSMPLLHTR